MTLIDKLKKDWERSLELTHLLKEGEQILAKLNSKNNQKVIERRIKAEAAQERFKYELNEILNNWGIKKVF